MQQQKVPGGCESCDLTLRTDMLIFRQDAVRATYGLWIILIVYLITLTIALLLHVARIFRYNVHQQSHQSGSGMCRYVRPVDMARHSRSVGGEARDAKSKRRAGRLSTLETGKEKKNSQL